MNTEVVYADGSMSTFHGDGGSFHDGALAIARLQLKTAIAALEIYLKYDGQMQLTRDGHRGAVLNVIEPMSGKRFSTRTGRVTMKSCREALKEAEYLLWAIENGAVVFEDES
jgi:hypothetical protein